MELVEQLAGYHFDDRFLVSDGGAPRVVWAAWHHHPPWFADTAALMQAWLGPIHPRVSTLHAAVPHARALLLVVDDDRGPTLADAAAQLVDPVERERWVVAQIAAIAEGVAALRTRDPAFVYGSLPAERIYLDESGHARLREPRPSAPAPPTSRSGGADLNAIRYLSPEVAMSRPPTAASDVFALAINLSLALAGRHPFGDSQAGMAIVMQILQFPHAPIATQTPALARVIDRALAKAPAARIPDPAAFAAELRACIPDAADYDAVVSDRLVPWRATLPEESPFPELVSWDEIAPALRG